MRFQYEVSARVFLCGGPINYPRELLDSYIEKHKPHVHIGKDILLQLNVVNHLETEDENGYNVRAVQRYFVSTF